MTKIVKPLGSESNKASQPSTLVPEVKILLEDLLSKKPNARVLDFGCGLGRYGEVVKSGGGSYLGLDIDPVSLGYQASIGCSAMHPKDLPSDYFYDILLIGNMSGIDGGMYLVNSRKQLKEDGVVLLWDESFQNITKGRKQRTLAFSVVGSRESS